MEMTDRQKKVLRSIVDLYIRTAEPVGSKAIAALPDMQYSSATIRNEMAELEALGYLEQPHTAAGRVPSELGYRYYVDALLERYRMTNHEIETINRTLHDKLHELDEILSNASRLASSLTNYTSIAIKPRPATVRVERYESMYVDTRNFVLVMLFYGGAVKTKYIHLDCDLSEEQQAALVRLLNLGLVGLTSEEITISVICSLEKQAGVAAPVIAPLVRAVYETMSEMDGGDVRVQGVNHLLEYPEYADVDRMKDMLTMFEKKDALLSAIVEEQTLNIKYGRICLSQ